MSYIHACITTLGRFTKYELSFPALGSKGVGLLKFISSKHTQSILLKFVVIQEIFERYSLLNFMNFDKLQMYAK